VFTRPVQKLLIGNFRSGLQALPDIPQRFAGDNVFDDRSRGLERAERLRAFLEFGMLRLPDIDLRLPIVAESSHEDVDERPPADSHEGE